MPDLQIDQFATLLAAATFLLYPATIGLRFLQERGTLILAPSSKRGGQAFQVQMSEPMDLDAHWQRIADQITSSLEQSRSMLAFQTRAERELDGTEYLLERLFEDVPMVASLCGNQSAYAPAHA